MLGFSIVCDSLSFLNKRIYLLEISKKLSITVPLSLCV